MKGFYFPYIPTGDFKKLCFFKIFKGMNISPGPVTIPQLAP